MTIKAYGSKEFTALQGAAADAPRRRSHLNVHEALDANVQRLFIATQPDTYMRPHRHPQSHKWEFFMVLEGRIELLLFNDAGEVTDRTMMSPEQVRAVEIPPNTWHAYICHQPGTLALEIKEGAYIPTPEEDFAPWSPAEGSPESAAYLDQLRAG